MSADEDKTTRGEPLPVDPAELEAAVEERRQRLAQTVDELVLRTRPRELARRGLADAKRRVLAATRTEDGALRVERLGAVAAAVAVLTLLLVWRRRRARGVD